MGRLGELERAVMDVLWAHDAPVSVRTVHDELSGRDLAYTTVMTVLTRLADKGFAARERDGRAWLYGASASRERYVAQLMLDALGQTSDRGAALASFARAVSDEDAEQLRRSLS